MGSDESRFNVLVGSDGQGHRTVSTNYNLSSSPSSWLLYSKCIIYILNFTLTFAHIKHQTFRTVILLKSTAIMASAFTSVSIAQTV